MAPDGAQAIAEARKAPAQIATLILPADTAWNEAKGIAHVPEIPAPVKVGDDAVAACARILRSGEPTLLMVCGKALSAEALDVASRIANQAGGAQPRPTNHSPHIRCSASEREARGGS